MLHSGTPLSTGSASMDSFTCCLKILNSIPTHTHTLRNTYLYSTYFHGVFARRLMQPQQVWASSLASHTVFPLAHSHFFQAKYCNKLKLFLKLALLLQSMLALEGVCEDGALHLRRFTKHAKNST